MFEFGCPVSLRLLKTYATRMTSTSQDDNADIVEKAPSGGDEPVLMGDDSVSLEVLAFASFVVNSCALFLCRRFRV